MVKAFTEQAERPCDIPYCISAICKKAKVTVNEWKTEASASSAMKFCTRSTGEVDFIIEHPFMYIIRNTETSTILFTGYIVNPNE